MNEVVLSVTLRVSADSVRDAEKLFDVWMSDAEEDERLIWYRVGAGTVMNVSD